MTDGLISNMAIRCKNTSVIFGGIIIFLFLLGCTTPPQCPPCVEKECPVCEDCGVCVDCPPVVTNEEAYVLYRCVDIDEVNNLIDTTNGLTNYINRFCTKEGQDNLTELPYLVSIEEVAD